MFFYKFYETHYSNRALPCSNGIFIKRSMHGECVMLLSRWPAGIIKYKHLKRAFVISVATQMHT